MYCNTTANYNIIGTMITLERDRWESVMRCFGDKANKFLVHIAPSDLAHHSHGWLHEPKRTKNNSINSIKY